MNKKQIFRLFSFPVFGILLLAIPLLRDFHFESAMLAGTIGCFWAAIRAAGSTIENDFFATLNVLGKLYLAGIPLFLYSLFSGCLTFDGFAFWIFTPFPSVFFGAAIGRLFRTFRIAKPPLFAVLILLFIAAGILLIEFFNFPQVYFYNHVWGVWPGPIYDEAVHFSESYLFFRWITSLWILLLWMIPNWNRNFHSQLITVLAAISLMFSYLYLDEMHIISPTESIQAELNGQKQSLHFDIYFDEEAYSEQEINYWLLKHEFYFNEITQKLELDWPENEKIQSYLYAHAWQKKKITGAKFTSYVPIWLDEGQLHIAKQQLEDVLKHELVHVLSREFGNKLYHGSLSIGLIEGLAEGIAKDASGQSTLHQIVAAEKPFPEAERMKSALAVAGFYGSAGAISYTTAGSFVEYLLNNYPVSNFKEAYASGDLEKAYDQSFEELIAGWHHMLNKVRIDSVDLRISEFIFAQRSLFQKTCPHHVSTEMRLWDEFRRHLAEEDTAKAYKSLDNLFTHFPENDLVFAEWARSKLHRDGASEIISNFSESDTLLTLQVLYADALFMQNGHILAQDYLQSISGRIENSDAANFKYTLSIREDSLQWQGLLQSRYSKEFPDSSTYQQLNVPNKWVILQETLRNNSDQNLIKYSHILFENQFNPDFFGIAVEMLDRLIFLEEFDLAKSWIQKISAEKIRLRYAERLAVLEEWLLFVELNKNKNE